MLSAGINYQRKKEEKKKEKKKKQIAHTFFKRALDIVNEDSYGRKVFLTSGREITGGRLQRSRIARM
jgi:hypothetical protein